MLQTKGVCERVRTGCTTTVVGTHNAARLGFSRPFSTLSSDCMRVTADWQPLEAPFRASWCSCWCEVAWPACLLAAHWTLGVPLEVRLGRLIHVRVGCIAWPLPALAAADADEDDGDLKELPSRDLYPRVATLAKPNHPVVLPPGLPPAHEHVQGHSTHIMSPH